MNGIEFLITLYLLANGIAFMAFGLDKWNARTNSFRVPETILLGLALPGPFGAFAGMQVFRHKTRKLKFLLVPGIAGVHIAIMLVLLARYRVA